jgi:hypothetical protein
MVQPGIIFIRLPPRLIIVASPRRELPDAATCRLFLLETSAWVLRPKLVNPPPMVLRPKPPNSLVSSVLRTRSPLLDTCRRRPRPAGRQVLWASLDLHVLRLDSVNTLTPMYTYACRCPRCQPPWLVTRPLVPRSKPHVHPSPLPVHRHGISLLDLHLAVDHRLRAPHLHNTSQETCRTHSFHHGRVSHHSTYFVDHIDNHSSQNEHTMVLVNLVFTERHFLTY